MRVLHFRSSFTFAGPEAVLLYLAVPLRRCGVETKIIAHYRRKAGEPARHRLVEETKRAGLEAEQWDGNAIVSPRVLGRLTQELVRGRFDLLHTHDPKSNLVGLLAARRARVPVVATVHLHDTSNFRTRMFRVLDLQTLRFFPRIIAVSSALRAELIAAHLPDPRIGVIHNGIDVSRFGRGAAERADVWRARWGGEDGGRIITTVGRLSPQKGIHTLLQAARLITQKQPRTRFWVVGSGPLRRELEAQARSLGIDAVVHWLGHQSDISGIMAASDVVAVPSIREGLPMVVLEALALSRPVVASAVGGISEVIEDGVSGWLVPPAEPAVLAARILHLIEHPEAGRAAGERGRARVMSEFAAHQAARQLASSYAALLGEARGIETLAVENGLG